MAQRRGGAAFECDERVGLNAKELCVEGPRLRRLQSVMC
jgi:hypothetical protein